MSHGPHAILADNLAARSKRIKKQARHRMRKKWKFKTVRVTDSSNVEKVSRWKRSKAQPVVRQGGRPPGSEANHPRENYEREEPAAGKVTN